MTEKSLYELEREDPKGATELAAACSTADASRLLRLAKVRSNITGEEVARLLGVTAGRVSQVVNGDGNVHIATLAKFLSAYGYDLVLAALDQDGAPLAERRRHRPTQSSEGQAVQWTKTDFDLAWMHDSGVYSVRVPVPHEVGTRPPRFYGAKHADSAWTATPEAAPSYEDDFSKAETVERIRTAVRQ